MLIGGVVDSAGVAVVSYISTATADSAGSIADIAEVPKLPSTCRLLSNLRAGFSVGSVHGFPVWRPTSSTAAQARRASMITVETGHLVTNGA